MSYTQADFNSRLNGRIQNKIGMLVSPQETMNDAVGEVLSDFSIRTSRRKASLVPNLFNGEYEYSLPSDLKGYAIIDIPQQAARSDGEFNLVPSQVFDTNKKSGDIAIDHYNGTGVLKINSKVSDKTIVASELDSTTSGGGTWVTRGDATTLTADTDDYVKGNGSLKFNIGSGATTIAGITNNSLNTIDVTDYLGGNGAVFIWHKINSVTNLTSFTLEFGQNSSNFRSKTITTKNDGTAFTVGWNLLRFDLVSLSSTGSPSTTVNYMSFYMNKTTGKVNESDYKVDYIVFKAGKNSDIKYYSKYGWVSATGTYLERSTATTDILRAELDEFLLIVDKAAWIAAKELDFPQQKIDSLWKDYDNRLKTYKLNNPSEEKIMGYDYYEYGNSNNDPDTYGSYIV